MNAKRLVLVLAAVAATLGSIGTAGYYAWWHLNYYTEEHTDYHEPSAHDVEFTDDRLEEKNPTFDPELIDSRPLGDWEVNASAAVTRLDCPAMKPDKDENLLKLRKSYAEAVRAAKAQSLQLLPSANLLDGAAKQFDDGLYAAIDLACFRGELPGVPSPPALVRGLLNKLPEGSPARPFLAAALEQIGEQAQLSSAEAAQSRAYQDRFAADVYRSKPVGFYTWSDDLRRVWRFFRFLQTEFTEDELEVPGALAATLAHEPELLDEYRTVCAFYGRLTNPADCHALDALLSADGVVRNLPSVPGKRDTVAVLPPSGSREKELFQALFPQGLPPGANLMTELISRIRTGQIDLAPPPDAGWYQHQVFALETLLLPTRGQESEKLLLTAKYKKRLVEAFKALLTKRYETHARQLGVLAKAAVPLKASQMQPRLRVEPCATFYLRTARAYGFVESFLRAAVGEQTLAQLHGQREGGREREQSLADELAAIRTRFYGFYLLACEDLGMRPQLRADEGVDVPMAMAAALDWLAKLDQDADLAVDTRIAVPVYWDPQRHKVRSWGVLGVRLARLEAKYARPPKIRPRPESARGEKAAGEPAARAPAQPADAPQSQWQDPEPYQLGVSRYVIAVDEFAEFETAAPLNRHELRGICDAQPTKEAILKELASRQ